MPIKAVIFDLDGTLTRPFFDFDAIRREMGLDKDAGPVLEAMEKMEPEQRKQSEQILHRHEQRAVAESTLNEGTRKTFETLEQRGIPIGILTRNRKANALAVAEKHDLKFDAIVDRHSGPVKPDAFGVRQICQQFGVKTRETMLVGDCLFDILSAKAAGAVAVLLVNTERAVKFADRADFTIEKIDRIVQIIEKINKDSSEKKEKPE